MPTIYTTNFSSLKYLPRYITPVSIALWSAREYNGLEYKPLAPSYKLLQEYKATYNKQLYTEQFLKYLSTLDAKATVEQLQALTHSDNIALVCYEKPMDFCHRHFVADWLQEAGYTAREYIFGHKSY